MTEDWATGGNQVTSMEAGFGVTCQPIQCPVSELIFTGLPLYQGFAAFRKIAGGTLSEEICQPPCGQPGAWGSELGSFRSGRARSVSGNWYDANVKRRDRDQKNRYAGSNTVGFGLVMGVHLPVSLAL